MINANKKGTKLTTSVNTYCNAAKLVFAKLISEKNNTHVYGIGTHTYECDDLMNAIKDQHLHRNGILNVFKYI